MFNKKYLLIGICILLIIISPLSFAICSSCQNSIDQLNNSLWIKNKQNELVVASADSVPQYNSTTTNTKDENNQLTTAQRQVITQRHNKTKVGPIPDDPNVEPMCSHAL